MKSPIVLDADAGPFVLAFFCRWRRNKTLRRFAGRMLKWGMYDWQEEQKRRAGK